MRNNLLLRSIYFRLNRSVYSKRIFSMILNPIIYWKAKRYQHIPPRMVHIENTNFCNARCVMCPNATMKRKKGILSFDEYKRIIDDLEEVGTKRINIHGIGEPLLDRNLLEKIRFAKERGVHVLTVTNGSLLNEELSNQLVSSGIDEVYFSVDAYDRERYSNIRIGLDRDRVYRNILDFIALKDFLKKKIKTVIRAIYIIQNERDLTDLKRFKDFWSSKNVEMQITNLGSWGENVDIDIPKGSIHNIRFLDMYPCRLLFTEPYISHDLKVFPCCYDYEGRLVLGDLRENRFREVWFHNERLDIERYRHLFDRGRKSSPCDRCDLTTDWLFK